MHPFDQVIAVIKIENRCLDPGFRLGPPPDLPLPFTSAFTLHGPRAHWIIGWEPLHGIVEVLGIMAFDPRVESANTIGRKIMMEFASVNGVAPPAYNTYLPEPVDFK
jgi:hypothetical protein